MSIPRPAIMAGALRGSSYMYVYNTMLALGEMGPPTVCSKWAVPHLRSQHKSLPRRNQKYLFCLVTADVWIIAPVVVK